MLQVRVEGCAAFQQYTKKLMRKFKEELVWADLKPHCHRNLCCPCTVWNTDLGSGLLKLFLKLTSQAGTFMIVKMRSQGREGENHQSER